MHEMHPYNDHSSIPEGTRSLIIGTAPPHRFSKPRPDGWALPFDDMDFYYGSKDNLLWKEIFPKVYQESFALGEKPSADKLRSFLRDKKLWMHDICEQYARTGTSSLDKHLSPQKHADLRRILEEHETINTLVFTGGDAEKWSGKQMEYQKLLPLYQFGARGIWKKPMPRERSFSIATDRGVRQIRTFTVPSPSPTTTRVYSLEEMIDIYRTVLLKNED